MSVTIVKSVKGSKQAANYKEQEIKYASFIYQNNMFGENPQERWEEMKEIAALNKRIEKPFLENVVSPPSEYVKDFSKEDWKNFAKEYAEKMNYNDNQWYAILHENTENPHLHILTNKVGFSGKTTIDDSYIGEKSGRIMQEISKGRGWKTAQELVQEQKTSMKQALLKSVASSTDWKQVKEKMEEQGFKLELSTNVNGLNGARIMSLEEIEKRKEKERKTVLMLKEKKEIQKESYISAKEKKLVKSGYTLSQVDREMKIKNLDKTLQENLKKEQKKSQSYGRKF
jgi:hypothetical protein